MVTYTHISIERLASGTRIEVPGFRDAEVMEIVFEGHGSGYTVTYCTDDWQGWDALDHFHVASGETVRAYDYQTFLRADSEITLEEWEAKAEAVNAASDAEIQTLRNLGAIAAMAGHVCRPINETVLVDAVADALGVPAMAAE